MMTPKTQKCEIQLFIGSTLGSLTNATHCPQKWTPNNNPNYKTIHTFGGPTKMGTLFVTPFIQVNPQDNPIQHN